MAAQSHSITRSTPLIDRLRNAVMSAANATRRSEHWVLLSCCDWYPDGSSYPTNHAAMLSRNQKPTSQSTE